MNFLPEPFFCDTETFSHIPINNGTWAYAEPVEVMIATYALGDGEVQVWDETLNPEMPHDLRYEIMNPRRKIVGHNFGNFDRIVMKFGLGMDLSTARIHDLMVQALCHGLPGSLDKLCTIFRVPGELAKDKEGKKLINLFCKPRPKNMKLRRATAITHPEEWDAFIEYAKKDITALRYLYKVMPNWNYIGKEFELWRLDQKINDRGFKVDLNLAGAAITAITLEQAKLTVRTQEITSGEVNSANQRDAIIRFILKDYGIVVPDLQAATVERFINDERLPGNMRELLAIRLQASTTSTGKYKKLIAAASSDGRLRGTLQFAGASRTMRWSGRTFQPQNLPSRNLPDKEIIEQGITAIKNGVVDLAFSDPMKIISAAIRGCIIAPTGRKLVVSDLSNIEGRMAAWLAGEEWKLEAFRLFDIDAGRDLYNLAYARSFHVDPDKVTKPQRQIGKVMELMLGYEGGVGAFITGALTYDIDLEAMAGIAYPNIPNNILKEAESMWNWAVERGKTYELPQKTFIVCDSIKRLWREANPAIASYWKELQNAAISATMNKGKMVICRKLKFIRKGIWLLMILPSGRAVCYPAPKIKGNKLSYKGVNQFTRQWGGTDTYGGKLFENACQAASRDVLAENMPLIEVEGYQILLTVHDENITETPDNDNYSVERLSELMSTIPEWAEGLPLRAGGFEGYRYRKD